MIHGYAVLGIKAMRCQKPISHNYLTGRYNSILRPKVCCGLIDWYKSSILIVRFSYANLVWSGFGAKPSWPKCL
jgi:hypothetical protein